MADTSVSYKCPHCDAPLSFQPGNDKVTCEYCGTELEISAVEDLFQKKQEMAAKAQEIYDRQVKPALEALGASLKLDDAERELEELRAATEAPEFWNDVANSQRVQQRIKALTNELYADVYDDVLGVADWSFSGRKAEFVERVMSSHEEIHRKARAMHAFDRKRDFAGQALFALFAIGICVWASYHFAAIVQAPAAIGVLDRPADWVAAFVLGLFPLLEAFAPLSDAAVGGLSRLDSVKRLNELESVPAILDEPETDIDVPSRTHTRTSEPDSSRIELKSVSFS